MELPSMVQRSGDTLIVRSVVSGNQLYADQQHNSIGPEVLNNMNTSTATTNNNNNNNNGSSAANGGVGGGLQVNPSISSSLIMEQIERLKRSQEAAQQIMQQQLQQQQQQQQAQQNAAMELKEEGLPQCKIKRNYSCSYCTYFTQNPRYHLTHLRDVHGEKIVINKCKLCLYASRHYQKLVRHMKMVHGCTEGVTSGHGQARGKRGMNRDRKRKLEDSMAQAGSAGAIKLMNLEAFNAEQLKADMEQKLNRDLDLFTQQQQQLQHEEQQKSQQQQLSITAANAFFAAAAYEHQLRAQRDMAEKDALRKNDHSNYERRESTSPPAPNEVTSDENYNNASHAQQKSYDYNPSSSSTSALNSNATAGNQQESKIQMPPQRLSYELTPSPSGSNSSPPPAGQSTSGSTTPLSVMLPTDEPSNNRLLKCSLCDFTTLYRNNLLEHEIEDHCDAKFYRCEKCSYVTHIKARFSKHVKYHSMPMIKCVTCDFRTPYKWNLDRHMKNHGGAGPFRCAACDFTADIKQSLTVHEMNHHVPPVGHAAGMTLARRRNKVGGTDLSEDFFSDSAEMLEDHFNNNNMDDYDEMLMTAGPVEGVYESKRLRYEEDEPTDLSQKGGSSDTSSVHNQAVSTKAKKPLPNLIPISKEGENILNLSSDMVAGGRYFNEKPTGGDTGATAAASQLSPTTTIASSSAASGKSLLARKSGSFFDKIKFSTTTNENLICPCGHMAKCLSESIIHRKSCTFGHDDIDLDDEDHDEDGEEGRLEIDFNEDDECDKQSQSALNLSVTGSTRCQHCRHRCKSSADLLNHLKICSEANSRCGDSLSGESSIGGGGSGRLMMGDGDHQQQSHHPMENRVFVWNKIPRNQGSEGSQSFDGSRGMHPNAHGNNGGGSGSMGPGGILSANNDENSYYGVETAPGYGEVTKKMTPEEEAANSSLKKVYKCPHCSFWASTASRFHVHIVGHLNKKPFECSLCSYRSNWRWDITKHIRLKTIRDPSHKNARVLMNDETGRRNYTKYNKYITLMKVTEEDGDPKLMKSGEMTPNQVASLAFINDYNQKQQQQQQQGSVASSGSTSLSNILNGVREDITLEPIPSKNSLGMVGDDNMADNFIRLPLLASMMNAAMAQQQHQKGQQANTDHENATLITPSVTISAVKKNPQTSSSSFKPSDEIILEVRPDSSEKNYKCRKCNFRHMNRDAVLAHVKVHFPDPNAPIVTATATTSPNKSSQLQATGPLQITANSNLYMNKVLAAMCLTQQPNSSANAQAQLSNLVAAGLLDQSGNSALSGLALALAGKSPLKASQLNAATAAANIIEHGEQKAILNDQASAENTMTSPNQLTLVKALQHNSQQQQQLQATSSLSSTSNCGYGPATAKSPSSSSSLQNLLTSPRGGRQSSNTASLDGGLNDTTMVMGSSKTTTTTATTNTTATTLTNKPGTMAITATANPPPPPSPQAIVTTTSTPISSPCTFNLTQAAMPTTPPPPPPPPFGSSASTLNSKHFGDGHHFTESDLLTAATASGCGVGGLLASNGVVGLQDLMMVVMGASSDHHLPNVGIKSSLSLSSNPNPIQTNQNQNSSTSNSSSATSIQNHTSSSSPSNSNNTNNASNNNLGHVSSGNGSNNTHNNNNNNNSGNGGNGNGNNNNNNNLLTHETATGDRRDPSPYRCGHCHQVSNWKHVIQRHCRLKHAGAINIETLDRAATGDRHMAPVYKPLVNGASISDQLQQQQHQSSNNNLSTNGQYSLTLKALQQQNNNNNSNNNTNTNHNNNSVLIDNNTTKMGMTNLPKSETPQSLLSSSLPLTGNSADLQAATVAYLAAAYKAAHSQNGINNATLANITNMAEELLLQQQLQKNDQIEITRVSSSSNGQQQHHLGLLNGQSSNLAQLLESNNNNAMNAPTPTNSGNNNKSKQQKCPLCTYICDSKSQMNYHISLHKPTQYECHLCTFVCAKKQHLSSHMRSVHQMLPQQQQQQLQQQQAFAAASSAALNMDFSLALKVAAAKNQQDSPLAIDLSGMKHNIAALNSPAQRSSVGGTNTAAKATSAASTQHLPPEYQYRLIYYCNRCPARYAQKHNDPLTAKNDLDEHLRQHEPFPNNPDDPRKCLCDYCDYRAAHENLIQAHRHVHTSQYQEKCNELYKNCKDDTVYRAPKLMHITATRKQHQHETIWVVDQDLNEGHIIKMGGQNSSITSSSANAGFEVGNSLLKKQLESKQSSPQNVNEMTHKDDKEESNAPASMSPDISEMENSLEKPSGRESNSPCHVSDNVEKCQHCPFESSLRSEFKTHIQQHICVSQQPLAYTCEHCDYTAEEQDHIDEHTRIHFNSMEKLKDVAFFTSYDKLELSMEQPLNEEEEVDTEGEANNQNEKAKETGNENNLELNIKKEITANNNNDEDRVNENLKQASNPNTTTATTTNNNEANTSTNPDENKSQKCAKIILYKNDGCLSIKKENNNNEAEQQDQQPQQNSSSSSNSQNISERLRRRISRPSGNAISSSSANNNNNNSTSDDQQQSTTTTSHKTILVNAKTGQVISRN